MSCCQWCPLLNQGRESSLAQGRVCQGFMVGVKGVGEASVSCWGQGKPGSQDSPLLLPCSCSILPGDFWGKGCSKS